MGGAGLQKVDIVGLQGVGMAVYTQITFAGDDVFQYKISGIGAEDMEIGVGISDAEALNGQGNFGGTVVDIGQHLILQSGETGDIFFSDMIKGCILLHGKIYLTGRDAKSRHLNAR